MMKARLTGVERSMRKIDRTEEDNEKEKKKKSYVYLSQLDFMVNRFA